MDKKIRWLRISYWTAAIADFLVAISALIPARMGVTHYVYPMGLMAAVAFSWGVMLIYADKQPLERRWILIPTILVVALLGLVAVHAGATGLISFARAVLTVVVTIIVLSILVYSHMKARESI